MELKGDNLLKWDEGRRAKLEQAAALDATWEEMAFFAGISKSTLYNWLDTIPGLRERLDELREEPVLKARQTVVSALSDPNHAFRYLEKKKRKEFGNSMDLTTGGEKLNTLKDALTVLAADGEDEEAHDKLDDPKPEAAKAEGVSQDPVP
jgi:hypothetical protein